MPIASIYKGRRAVVLNHWLPTFGGGEWLSLQYARALQDLGFETEICCRRPVPSAHAIADAFGNEFQRIPIRRIRTKNAYAYFHGAGLSVFINHSFMDYSPNPALFGIYALMFPLNPERAKLDPAQTSSLWSYQVMTCISEFVRSNAVRCWNFPEGRMALLAPPLSDVHIGAARLPVPPKQKLFLNVGRFAAEGHQKNQELLIRAFLEARASFPSLRDWRFVLCGRINPTRASRQYFKRCLRLAKKHEGIEIRPNASRKEVLAFLNASFGYVHGAGDFSAGYDDPYQCEHFGISIAEAMAHGNIPLVYEKGGILDILDAQMGLTFTSYDHLIKQMERLAALWQTKPATEMQGRCQQASLALSYERFKTGLARLTSDMFAPEQPETAALLET